MRTPAPSDWEHAKILMSRNLRNDGKKPQLWFARVFGMPLLLMIYTLGFFLSYSGDSTSVVQGGYRIHAGEDWVFPKQFRMAGADGSIVSQVSAMMGTQRGLTVNIVAETNDTAFQALCETEFNVDPNVEVCIYLDSLESFAIFYGGADFVSPFEASLAGAQWAVSSAMLNVSGYEELYPVRMTQRVPQLVNKDTSSAPTGSLIVPGLFLVLSSAVMLMFIMAPLTNEKLTEVVRSFVLVGVKLRTYMLSWVLYYSINGLITAGGLAFVSIGWKTYPQSNAGLIFLSHYLGLVGIYSQFTFLSQLIEQEELAQGIPWLVSFAGMAVGVSILILQSPSSILMTIVAAISPTVGMLQYSAIYVNYEASGFDTGIHPGDNVASSGLLGNIIAQVVCIMLWIGCILAYTSPAPGAWGSRQSRDKVVTQTQSGVVTGDTANHDFEPLLPGSETLLSVRGLFHKYEQGCVTSMCGKKSEPLEVLHGLDLDICRGEVFSYLGHNGAGKTTSIGILSGEITLQDGDVTFHFSEGPLSLRSGDDLDTIRSKIGVCPQHNNALQENLTCREMLRLFAHLKGRVEQEEGQSKEHAVEAEIQRRLDDIQFTSAEDADKAVGTYSGGMKRKVSIALALLGDPEVVFLDEPTAGMDPCNRRIIWDMITAAKVGRSIILTTHFMDEADVLSDRVGIIKKGKLVTCGSPLFLKHHFGVGYTLRFDAADYIHVDNFVNGANHVPLEKPGAFEWRLNHGSESSFPAALTALSEAGARSVILELTTLEQVFLAIGKEDAEKEDIDTQEDEEQDRDDGALTSDLLSNIWESKSAIVPLTKLQKFLHVQHFMMTNALKIKGVVFLNIALPLVYMILGLVIGTLVENPTVGDRIIQDPILISPFLAGMDPSQCFGLPVLNGNPIAPIVPTKAPEDITEYFPPEGVLPITCGYFVDNRTLQYDPTFSVFALQLGSSVLTNYTVLGSRGSGGIGTRFQQLPYLTDVVFRVDLLVVPMAIGFGFTGMAFVVLDVLLLKGEKIIEIFRVAGITEWSAYLGVVMYKCSTTFLPFFVLTIIVGLALQSVIFGNAGRWLGTLLILLSYAYSTTPIGLILAKRFIHGDFKSVVNWFPGVYMTLVSLPYVAYTILLQTLPQSRDAILVLGDILCFIPVIAFQRGIGAVIEISTLYDDPALNWATVWSWESRVWFTIIMMLALGTIEWIFLYKITTGRAGTTKLSPDEESVLNYDTDDVDVLEERERSHLNDDGIKARDLVKVFRVEQQKIDKNLKVKRSETILKKAVKGVSYGVEKNEIYVLLGPNGAGKTTAMAILAGVLTPENGEIALAGKRASREEPDINYLYNECDISYCPQFDALFPRKTVVEHLRFYACVRGLAWDADTTKDHITAITRLLGLSKHANKEAKELSGGYKRRLSLAVSLIGYPKCMLVDECTTGMDPGARHQVWGVLKPPSFHHEYDLPAIMLSTHYMDEAAHLGDRIGIMVDGDLVTTGSLDRLQERYCTSYFVEVSLRDGAPESAQDDVLGAFVQGNMDAVAHESLPFHFKFRVPFADISGPSNTKQLAMIFSVLESNKENLYIKFYSVSQMNLEQIFINLSRMQVGSDVFGVPAVGEVLE